MLRTLPSRVSFILFFCFVFLVVATPVVAANSRYSVQRGDTLYSIAQRLHTTVARLEALNRLRDVNYLREGQQLVVQSTPHASESRTLATHRRQRGEVLAGTRLLNRRIAKLLRGQRARTTLVRSMSPQDKARAMVATQALWIATHAGGTLAGFTLSPAYVAAQRTLAFELRLTKTALRFLGVPYAWGGTSFSGVDCSGFVQAVFHRNGIDLPRTADAQFEVGRPVSAHSLRPGDLVFFQTYALGASHVGIYVGAGHFVHASSSNGVRVDSLSEAYYSSRFIGARREVAI